MDKEKPSTSGSHIDEEKSKPTSRSSETSVTITTSQSDSIRQRRRIGQSFLLIWLSANTDQSEEDHQNTLSQLQTIVNDINIFTQPDECVDFLTDNDDMKAFLIVSNTSGRQMVPLIHDVPQLNGIYIFCNSNPEHEQWANEWMKVKGIHTEIMSIRESFQQAIKQHNQDSIAVSFIPRSEEGSSQNLNQLEPSFMYTQIFKEILLEMEDSEQSIKDFVLVLRDYYSNNNSQLNIIAEFERDYRSQTSIKWYTREPFVYEILNRALRLMEADTIINMRFFIRDLHHQIEELHKKQIGSHHVGFSTVYRGQGLSKTDFEKLVKAKGGLMSFNNFLSTSTDQDISLIFAESASKKFGTVGIFFQMSINPSASSAHFASIQEASYFQTEEEILFSMHTVFRIEEITKIADNNTLYQVDLKLTTDDDQQLRTLTERIQNEIEDETGWQRLGHLLLRLNQFDKAKELYTVLLEKASGEEEKALYYNQLGCTETEKGDYQKAIEFYEKALEIDEKILPPNHPLLATYYNNIGRVYENMGVYSKALSFYEKALEIKEKILPPNDPEFALSYNNIGLLYDNMGEHSQALLFHEKALEIFEKTLLPNHPYLAQSYNNIGSVYDTMGEYSKALSFYEKALEIQQKTLPPDHSDLTTSYNNIGTLYYKTGQYSKALALYEKSLEIKEKTLPPNHPSLTISYNNISLVYNNMEEHSKALSFYEKALEIQRKTLPSNHPLLATSYNNIGLVYVNTRDYSHALSFFEKALEIFEKTLPPNHPSLTTSCNNIGEVYNKMGEYSKAISFYEKVLEIRQKTLPPNHPDLAMSYNNIGLVYGDMGEYSKALSFYEKSLEVNEETPASNHPHLATSYNNIGMMYANMGEYSTALSFYERALNIFQTSLPSNHPNINIVQGNIEYVKKL